MLGIQAWQAGAGSTVTVGGNNSNFSGGFNMGQWTDQATMSNVTLKVNHANALGTGILTMTYGTVDLNNFNPVVSALNGSNASGNFVQNNATGTSILTVGDSQNRNSSYAGVLKDGGTGKVLALTKAGSGTLTLSGTNTYSGATNINKGTLSLGAAGSLDTSSIAVKAGAVFNTAAQSYAIPSATPITIHLDSAGDGSSGKIKAASLNITDATVVVEIDNETALDDPVYVLAEYTSLTGTEFSSVTAPPSGYVIDYAYDSGTKIAWVQDSGTDYDDWASIYDPADLSDKNADNDGDGMSNFQEYAFGLDPISAASSNPIRDLSQLATAKIFKYSRRATSGLNYTILASSDLDTWQEAVALQGEPVSGPGEGVETITVEILETHLPANAASLFIRVKAK